MEVIQIPTNMLHADEDFNSRGIIDQIDVASLRRSIEANGLQYPILTMKYSEQDYIDNPNRRPYSHLIISGYRRFTACRMLGYSMIPCLVRENLPILKARILNLEENLEREDLNILQEAKALEKLKIAGMTQEMVAEELGKSRSWVQVRFIVLNFPEDIQQICAEGLLNQQQIRAISMLPRTKQYEAVREIKNKKLRGERGISVKLPVSSKSKRARVKAEINAMLDHVYDNAGASFATECLAWAAGNISSYDIFKRIKDQVGDKYIIPLEELK